MIEEYGRVVDVNDGVAWIEGVRTGTCSACSVHGGCGAGAIAKMLGQRRLRLRAINRIDAEIGDQVVIGIPETGLLYGSLAVYAVPLLALLGGALAGDRLGTGDGAAIAGAVAGLCAGLAWLRHFSHRNRNHPAYQPVVLRRVFTGLPTG
jgi:sigma-E factor negative regulatory protein RseC